MVKSFCWFISNMALWSDWRCKPANVFYRNEKSLSKFVWFLDTKNTHASKKTFRKDSRVPILLTLQVLLGYLGQTKILVFPSIKFEFLFSHHAEFFCFWFRNGLLVNKGVLKSRYCWKKKEKAQNFSPTYQKLREKKKYFLTFNPQMKSWHMMYKKVQL